MKNLLLTLYATAGFTVWAAQASAAAGNVRPIQEGYLDANGVFIYYVGPTPVTWPLKTSLSSGSIMSVSSLTNSSDMLHALPDK